MTRFRPRFLLPFVALLTLAVACSDDDDPTQTGSADRNIVGSWYITVVTLESTCGGFAGEVQSACVVIDKAAGTVTMSMGGDEYPGTMTGSYTAEIDISEGSGCPINNLVFTVGADGESLTGSHYIECPSSATVDGCTETGTVTGTRESGGC